MSFAAAMCVVMDLPRQLIAAMFRIMSFGVAAAVICFAITGVAVIAGFQLLCKGITGEDVS